MSDIESLSVISETGVEVNRKAAHRSAARATIGGTMKRHSEILNFLILSACCVFFFLSSAEAADQKGCKDIISAEGYNYDHPKADDNKIPVPKNLLHGQKEDLLGTGLVLEHGDKLTNFDTAVKFESKGKPGSLIVFLKDKKIAAYRQSTDDADKLNYFSADCKIEKIFIADKMEKGSDKGFNFYTLNPKVCGQLTSHRNLIENLETSSLNKNKEEVLKKEEEALKKLDSFIYKSEGLIGVGGKLNYKRALHFCEIHQDKLASLESAKPAPRLNKTSGGRSSH